MLTETNKKSCYVNSYNKILTNKTIHVLILDSFYNVKSRNYKKK